VSIHDEIAQRKGARNAKSFRITPENRDFSCDRPGTDFIIHDYLREPCVFAVKPLFTDHRHIVEYGRAGFLVKSVSRPVFTDIMFVCSAVMILLDTLMTS
jgi:hypothetical protein